MLAISTPDVRDGLIACFRRRPFLFCPAGPRKRNKMKLLGRFRSERKAAKQFITWQSTIRSKPSMYSGLVLLFEEVKRHGYTRHEWPRRIRPTLMTIAMVLPTCSTLHLSRREWNPGIRRQKNVWVMSTIGELKKGLGVLYETIARKKNLGGFSTVTLRKSQDISCIVRGVSRTRRCLQGSSITTQVFLAKTLEGSPRP